MVWCELFYPTMILLENADEAALVIGEFSMYCFEFGFNQKSVGNSAGTIKSKLSAISYGLKLRGQRGIIYTPALTMLLKGLTKMSGGAKRKRPFTFSMLDTMFDLLAPFDLGASVRSMALWGTSCLMMCFLLRRSEAAYTKRRTFKRFVLRAIDVRFYDSNLAAATSLQTAHFVAITLRASKNDPLGASTTRILPRSENTKRCPVTAAWFMKRNALATVASGYAGSSSPPLSSFSTDGAGITASDLSAIVKKIVNAMGLPTGDYGTHSFRAGGATELIRAGVDPAVVQLFGRWMSEVYKRYTHLSPQVGLDIMRKLDNTSQLDIDAAML